MGTRPDIIKLSPVIRECECLGLDYFMIHTGQHYSNDMDGIFFEQLELPQPKYNLGIGSGTYADEVSKAIKGIEGVLLVEKPSIVLVYGDTNSCIAGTLAALRCGITVGHIEAGLRSYFSGMPEEINRVIVDHCSDLLFAPTSNAEQNLLKEGISPSKIFVTGNTVVDAIYQNVDKCKVEHFFLESLTPEGYILATVHRLENVDSYERFASILAGLEKVALAFNIPVVYPIHPRARKMMAEFEFNTTNIKLCNPVGYLEFLWLEKNAKLIMTDSGGVQEEACILETPCVTLRDNTERLETIEVGSNILAGTSEERILECAVLMTRRNRNWTNPFGDGKAGENIVEIIGRKCG